MSFVAFPQAARKNLIADFTADLQEEFNETEKFAQSFASVALDWLGYDDDERIVFVDGSNDRGLDAYILSEDTIKIFQFKAQDFTKSFDPEVSASADIITDVSRILGILQTRDIAKEVANPKVKQLLSRLQVVTSAYKAEPNKEELFNVEIYVVAMYDGLTASARSEFDNLAASTEMVEIFGEIATCKLHFIDLNALLAEKWHTSNDKWQDATGKTTEHVQVKILQSSSTSFINENKALIFFGRAKDFIDAYRRLGYQIFEANVRCEITKSSVNDAIRKQVTTEKGIDEFLFLNNGLTITCLSKSPPKGGKVSIHRPQIVNGLQTVTSLHEAYECLSPKLRNYFDENCYLIVRVYDQRAISDVAKLVTATNNQNRMEPRNLHSNNKDQILFEQLFAKLGWFYERKDFAWQAFEREERQWATLKGYSAGTFKVKGKAGRPVVRKIGNEEAGQTWLSFVGYVDDAAQRRRLIFDDKKNHYNRIFNQRMTRHAFDYDYKFSNERIEEETLPSSPTPEALLLANLTYRVAKNLVPSAIAHKKAMIEKYGLAGKSPKEQDEALTSKSEYISGLAMASGPFLFTELCGFVLLRCFGGDFYEKAGKILKQSDLECVHRDLRSGPITDRKR